jgi:hypothetical protein
MEGRWTTLSLSEDVTASPQRQPNGSNSVCSWFTVDLDTNDLISVTDILYEMVHMNANLQHVIYLNIATW